MAVFVCELNDIRCTRWGLNKCNGIVFHIQQVLREPQDMMWACWDTEVNGTGIPLSFKSVRVGDLGGLYTEPHHGHPVLY